MLDLKSFSALTLRIIDCAEEEAHRLGHNFIGLEQLLVGILKTDSRASQLLVSVGLSLEVAQTELEQIIGRGAGFVATEIPFVPQAKQAIELAMSMAKEQGFPLVEPEHILLAIANSETGCLQRLLQKLGISMPQLQELTLELLQTLPRQTVGEVSSQVNLVPAIPPVSRKAPTTLSVITLPQETGRWVAEVTAHGLFTHGPTFKSIGYGDSDFQALAQALESLAQMYRNYECE